MGCESRPHELERLFAAEAVFRNTPRKEREPALPRARVCFAQNRTCQGALLHVKLEERTG